MSEPTEVLFELTAPFEYASKGEQREAQFITLLPPTMRQHSQAAALRQSIMRMVAKAQREAPAASEDDDEDEGPTAEMVRSIIYTSEAVEANVVWEQAKALFKEGVALIDGEQKITAPLIEKMSPTDFENMAGEYIVNFTLA